MLFPSRVAFQVPLVGWVRIIRTTSVKTSPQAPHNAAANCFIRKSLGKRVRGRAKLAPERHGPVGSALRGGAVWIRTSAPVGLLRSAPKTMKTLAFPRRILACSPAGSGLESPLASDSRIRPGGARQMWQAKNGHRPGMVAMHADIEQQASTQHQQTNPADSLRHTHPSTNFHGEASASGRGQPTPRACSSTPPAAVRFDLAFRARRDGLRYSRQQFPTWPG